MESKLIKFILAAVCLLLNPAITMAQSGRFSIGPEMGIPVGDFSRYASLGFGGTVGYEYPIGDKIGIGLRAGYITFGGKDGNASQAIIPLQAFFKYYFLAVQDGFYAMGSVGMTNGKANVNGAESSTKLSYAPELGYHLANIDLGFRYQLVSTESYTTSWIGIRFAFVFGNL
ncbi:MAG: outer membrane beta-barrel protein [Bacteroidia bacterium]